MPSILVVDDDPQLRQFIRDVLEAEGLEVETAADGRQALDLATSRPPALVVLDITLPNLGSSVVADRLRAALGDRLPILVITADGNAAQKAEQVRAYAHLRKPFAMDELLAAVHRGLASG
jgi:DNA-binding response OmpR family regulator